MQCRILSSLKASSCFSQGCFSPWVVPSHFPFFLFLSLSCTHIFLNFFVPFCELLVYDFFVRVTYYFLHTCWWNTLLSHEFVHNLMLLLNLFRIPLIYWTAPTNTKNTHILCLTYIHTLTQDKHIYSFTYAYWVPYTLQSGAAYLSSRQSLWLQH